MAGAEPFRFDVDGEVGALLLHGFSGSPFELRALAEILAARGVGSVAPLLRGHGTHPEDLLRCSYHDWLADAEMALEDVQRRYRVVFLVGLSMGGTLALLLAARHATDAPVGGVVPICAPIRLHDWRLGYIGFLKHVVRWRAWGAPDIKDVNAWDRIVGYRRFRTASIAQVIALVDVVREALPHVRQPALVVQARADHVVCPSNAEAILGKIGSRDKRLLWLENSYHVATVDHDAPLLNAAISEFIAARAVRATTLAESGGMEQAV